MVFEPQELEERAFAKVIIKVIRIFREEVSCPQIGFLPSHYSFLNCLYPQKLAFWFYCCLLTTDLN